jgi:hypothetical protein
MSRAYTCDALDCDNVCDGVPIEVTYYAVEDEDDDDPCYSEAHFCSFVCLSSWSTAIALDYPVPQ